MSHFCYFHPISQAKWRCNQCFRYYDNACVPKANEKQHQGICPLCESPLKHLPTETLSGDAKFYPLRDLVKDCFTSTHFYLLFLSASFALLVTLVDIHSSLKILLCFSAMLFIHLHFARESSYHLHQAQQTGRRSTALVSKRKRSSLSMLAPATSIQLSLFSVLLLVFPAYCFYSLHWFTGLLLIFIGGAAFPFLIIFSFHSSDNSQGVSLATLFKEIKPFNRNLINLSLGLYCFVLFVNDLALSLTSLTVAMAISLSLSALCLFVILNMCAKVFTFNLIKLGKQNQKRHEPKGPTSIYNHDKISTLDIDIDQALKTGQYQKVMLLLEDALKRNGNSNLRRQQLYLLLKELNDKEKLARYAGLFLYWMLERNKIKDAGQFLYQLRKDNPAFVLHDLSLMNKLARQFVRTKKYALVLWLTEDAKTRFKPSEDLASLYIFGTQALITHFKDLKKAEEYLLFILNSCSDFPSVEAAKALLIHLQNNQKKLQDLRR